MILKYPNEMMFYIKTTELCQLKCSHCYLGKEHPNIKFNPDKVIDWLVNFHKETGSNIGICLHGGEPLLVNAKIIDKFIDKVNSLIDNVKWSICTNLVYELTEERLNLLKKINNVATSWDTSDINRFTGNQEILWKKNLDICNKHLDMTVIISLSKELILMDVCKFHEMLQIFDVKYVIFERIMGGNSLPKHLVPTNLDINRWCYNLYIDYIESEQYKKCSNTIFDSIINATINGGKPSTYLRDCSRSVMTLHADGSISGCPSEPNLIYGSLDNTPEELLKSKARIKFATIERCHSNICFDCDVFDICGGGCVLLDWQDDICLGLPEVLRYIRNNKDVNKYEFILKYNKYIKR